MTNIFLSFRSCALIRHSLFHIVPCLLCLHPFSAVLFSQSSQFAILSASLFSLPLLCSVTPPCSRSQAAGSRREHRRRVRSGGIERCFFLLRRRRCRSSARLSSPRRSTTDVATAPIPLLRHVATPFLSLVAREMSAAAASGLEEEANTAAACNQQQLIGFASLPRVIRVEWSSERPIPSDMPPSVEGQAE